MGKTITEKIFDAHLVDEPFQGTFILKLDRVFCHEITTPVAINDLIMRGKDRVFNRSRIKAVIDHVSPAKDTKTAQQGKIMRDWARRHRIKDFFDIGSNGVCHALFPEKGFVQPGFTVIMGDSHTCTHGAFGAFAAGVGTTDLEVGILKGVCAFRKPRTIRINLNGKLSKGVYAKDVILKVIKTLTVKGATDCILEFQGPVVDKMTMESRMTLCNMAIEAGGTSGVCMPDKVSAEFLWPFIKARHKTVKNAVKNFSKWHSDKDAVYEKVTDLDVTKLAPQVTLKYKPDHVENVGKVKGTAVDQVYIGSCTNGRLEDLKIAARILKGRKISSRIRGIVSPATTKLFNDVLKMGIIDIFLKAGFCVTNPTCGACLGMSNGVLAEGEVCASTTNRNFYGRMGKGGMVHLMSPATAAATAIEGKIADPRRYLK
jgi:3-isopropylmalate/(R)-2-methylmalate dehydratase large subunit